ncbi:RluA family pseudouridine synthase [Camelimonas abortus]|uniref:Ribosomal large subunit pseudouridine synthase D n=1 Tax=Camelimonas abortus TaxID=1017184 RepID=A0ABV7LF78_9HYPH
MTRDTGNRRGGRGGKPGGAGARGRPSRSAAGAPRRPAAKAGDDDWFAGFRRGKAAPGPAAGGAGKSGPGSARPPAKAAAKAAGRFPRKGAGRAGAAGRGPRRDEGYRRPGWNPAAGPDDDDLVTADALWGDLWRAPAADDDIDWEAVEAEAAAAPDGDDGDDGDAPPAPAKRAARPAEPRPEAAAPARKGAGRAGSGHGAPLPGSRAKLNALAAETMTTGVQTLVVDADEADMRIDRFLTARFPQLAFTHIQRIVRKGELRVDGRRAKPNDRLQPGQKVRVPPLKLAEARPVGRTPRQDGDDAAFLRSLILYEDRDIMVLNKPMGLAVQGGSGTRRHIDGMLESLRDPSGQKPRLVHRLDKDTAGCLVVAKTRLAASVLGKSFRSRVTRKIYWALVAGAPRVKQGRVSTFLARQEDGAGGSRMAVVRHGDDDASHAVTYYAVVESAAQKVSWLSLKPVTGRTHQLRVHMAHIGHPIVGDPLYFNVENWEPPGGVQKKLHLLARRIIIPHPRDGRPIDVTAPLPPHMAQTWNLLGFDASRYDPIIESPDA